MTWSLLTSVQYEACANKRRQGLKQETTKGWFVTWFLILLRAEFFIPSLLCLLTRLFIILWTFSIMLASRSSSLRVISSSRASWNPTVLASNYTHNKHTGTCEPSVVKSHKTWRLGPDMMPRFAVAEPHRFLMTKCERHISVFCIACSCHSYQ